MNILDFGLNKYKLFNKNVPGHNIGRIVSEHKTSWEVITDKGKLSAIITQTFRNLSDPINLPKIGDYVKLESIENNKFKIIEVLPRFSVLARTKSLQNKVQVLATNIDFAILIFGLDQKISIQDIRNYAALCEDAKIDFIITLSKLDKIKSPNKLLTDVKSTFKSNKIFEISNKTGVGIDQLQKFLEQEKTYILLGPSGSGKSSLINYLFQQSVQTTNSTSNKDQQGKHTTTSRNMFTLPNKSIIIDSPGLRTLEIKTQHVTKDLTALEELASSCRFRNCDHQKSKSCAILKALRNKTITKQDYMAFIHQLNPNKPYIKKRSRN